MAPEIGPWDPDPALPFEKMVFHPFAGDADGHNCVDCIDADDHLHKCWPRSHGVPRWDQDRARINLGFPTGGRCGICGSEDHDEGGHRVR